MRGFGIDLVPVEYIGQLSLHYLAISLALLKPLRDEAPCRREFVPAQLTRLIPK